MAATISILILTHNRADDLLALLQSLNQQQGLATVLQEILILNNASTESYKQVEDFIITHPLLKVNYIFSHENTGVARGRNKLMQMAKGDLLLTIDDDMEFPQEDALLRMGEVFNKPFFKDNNTAVVTVKVIYHSTKEVQKTVFPHKKFEQYFGKETFLTLYFAGGANLMKSTILKDTGLFPENFFYGMEEYDLCYRILDAGYSIGYEDSITIEHKESPQGRQANYKKLQMQWLNKTIVAWRYLPMKYVLSTAILWSVQFLKKSPFHIGTYFSTWYKIFGIPYREQRKVVRQQTLDYLQKVEARLWY